MNSGDWKDVHLERPFGAHDSIGARQRVCKNVVPPHDELGSEDDMKRLCPTENTLGNRVQGRGTSAPLFAEIGYRRGVVHKDGDRGIDEESLKTEDTPLHC